MLNNKTFYDSGVGLQLLPNPKSQSIGYPSLSINTFSGYMIGKE